MIDKEEFGRAFAEHTHFRTNKYHPLVWIHGDPQIGKNVFIGAMSEVNATGARVTIGDNCDIGSFVAINCADSHRACVGLSDAVDRRDILLEESVFVGSHCMIKGGAKIGHHSVVAAGTIVEGRSIPPYSLVIGNPMTVKEGYYASALSRREIIPHTRPSLGPEEEMASIVAIRSGFLAQGRDVAALEDDFCAFLGLGTGHAVAVSSASAALFMALRGVGAEGNTVAFPAYAFPSIMSACRLVSARPHLVDCAAGSPCADLGAVRSSVAHAAVIPHMFGIPNDLAALGRMKVIEDCSNALGAKVNGSFAGLQGDAAVYSFFATELMTSGGEGGMIVARDRALADTLRDFRDSDQRTDRLPGFGFRMTDLQAAIAREQLKKLPGFLEKRQEIFAAYQAAGLDLVDGSGRGNEPVRSRAVLKTTQPLKVISKLERIGASAIVPLGDWELGGEPSSYPNALELCRTSVSLPIYPTLEKRDRDAIIATLTAL